MLIGVPRETKDMEFRVGVVPDGVRQLCARGHEVIVERSAGVGSGFSDADYEAAGARIGDTKQTWSEPLLVVKVKEPQHPEIARLRSGQVLFAYLHLAAAPRVTEALCEADVIAIA